MAVIVYSSDTTIIVQFPNYGHYVHNRGTSYLSDNQ